MDSILSQLENNRTSFLGEIDGLTPEQWSARPAQESWSILDVVEHIATVEIGVLDVLRKRLFQQPCPPEFKVKTIGKDQLIHDAMQDRITRRIAPDLVKPAGRWPAPTAAVEAFDRARQDAISLLSTETRDLRDYCAPHPSFKALDGHQWMVFVVTHTERHREQIKEIRTALAVRWTPTG